MTDWRKKLIEKAEEVITWGWGQVSISITKNGKKRAFKQTFDEIDEEKSELRSNAKDERRR